MKREASDLLRKLVFDFGAPEWNEYDLPRLRGWELEILARLLAAPKTGPKEKVVVRILCTRTIRQKLSRYPCDETGIVGMLADFQKEALKWMAKQMCVWRSGNKRQPWANYRGMMISLAFLFTSFRRAASMIISRNLPSNFSVPPFWERSTVLPNRSRPSLREPSHLLASSLASWAPIRSCVPSPSGKKCAGFYWRFDSVIKPQLGLIP